MRDEKNITEERNPKTIRIDRVSTTEMLVLLNEEDRQVPKAVEEEIPQIARAVDQIAEAMKQGGRLIYLGAGTSGRLGILDASEVASAFGLEEGRILAFVAGGEQALKRSLGGAQDDRNLGVEELKGIGLTAQDIVVGISSSGSTPYVTGALEFAKRQGCLTIALTCTHESECSQIADIIISPVVGPEAIAGATRLKSATAHKMVLNMISTGVMIRLGKVYENLMVDLSPSNSKLMRRRTQVVCMAVGCSEEEAQDLLAKTGGNARAAILMGLAGVDTEEAMHLLQVHENDVKAALEAGRSGEKKQPANVQAIFE